MGWQGIRWVSAMIAGVGIASPLAAREADRRIDIPLLRAGYPLAALRKDAVSKRALSLLGDADRNGLRAARTHGVAQSFGPFDLALEATRVRGGHGADDPFAAGDRYSASILSLSTEFDLGDGLHVGPTASLMHMRRHFSVVPAGLRPHTADIASLGIGVRRDEGPSLSLDYVSTSMRHVRPLDRMAEIAGGAPLAGHGLRLGISGGSRDPRTGGVTWGLSVSALQRPRSDFWLNDVAGTLTDKRLAISIGKSF